MFSWPIQVKQLEPLKNTSRSAVLFPSGDAPVRIYDVSPAEGFWFLALC